MAPRLSRGSLFRTGMGIERKVKGRGGAPAVRSGMFWWAAEAADLGGGMVIGSDRIGVKRAPLEIGSRCENQCLFIKSHNKCAAKGGAFVWPLYESGGAALSTHATHIILHPPPTRPTCGGSAVLCRVSESGGKRWKAVDRRSHFEESGRETAQIMGPHRHTRYFRPPLTAAIGPPSRGRIGKRLPGPLKCGPFFHQEFNGAPMEALWPGQFVHNTRDPRSAHPLNTTTYGLLSLTPIARFHPPLPPHATPVTTNERRPKLLRTPRTTTAHPSTPTRASLTAADPATDPPPPTPRHRPRHPTL